MYPSLKSKIEAVGIENVMFLLSMQRVRYIPVIGKMFGMGYKNSSDKPVTVPATVSEDYHQLKDNHKITLVCLYDTFGQEHYYLRDLELMLEEGRAQMFVNAKSKGMCIPFPIEAVPA